MNLILLITSFIINPHRYYKVNSNISNDHLEISMILIIVYVMLTIITAALFLILGGGWGFDDFVKAIIVSSIIYSFPTFTFYLVFRKSVNRAPIGSQ